MPNTDLSQRETEVHRLIGHGLSNKQIARELTKIDGAPVSDGTVKEYAKRIANKLGVHGRVLVALAYHGIIIPSQDAS